MPTYDEILKAAQMYGEVPNTHEKNPLTPDVDKVLDILSSSAANNDNIDFNQELVDFGIGKIKSTDYDSILQASIDMGDIEVEENALSRPVEVTPPSFFDNLKLFAATADFLIGEAPPVKAIGSVLDPISKSIRGSSVKVLDKVASASSNSPVSFLGGLVPVDSVGPQGQSSPYINFLSGLAPEVAKTILEVLPLTGKELTYYGILGGVGKAVGSAGKAVFGTPAGKVAGDFLNTDLKNLVKGITKSGEKVPIKPEFVKTGAAVPSEAAVLENPAVMHPISTNAEVINNYNNNLKVLFPDRNPQEVTDLVSKAIKAELGAESVEYPQMVKRVIHGISNGDDATMNYVYSKLYGNFDAIPTKSESALNWLKARAYTDSETTLRKMGVNGGRLADALKDIDQIPGMTTANEMNTLNKLYKALPDTDKKVVEKYLRGSYKGEVSLDTKRFAEEYRKIYYSKAKEVIEHNKQAAEASQINGVLPEKYADWKVRPITVVDEGGERLWTPRENYVPNSYNWAEILNDKKKYAQATEYLVKTGQASDLAKAKSMIKHASEGSTVRRVGGLEHARTLDLPFENTSLMDATYQYLHTTNKRLASIKTFGADDKVLNQMLAGIAEEGGNANTAKEVVDFVLGRFNTNKSLSKAITNITTFEALSKLGLAAVSNIAQIVNPMVAYGMRKTLTGFIKSFTKESAEIALRTNSLINTTLTESGGASAVAKLFKANGFTAIDEMLRKTSGRAAVSHVEDMAKRLAKNALDDGAIRQIKLHRLNPSDIIKQGGKLTTEQRDLVFNSGAAQTQFTSSALDLPIWASNPYARPLFQFRSFVFQQGKFIQNHIVNEAKAGNPIPLIRMMIYGQAVGESVSDIKSVLYGKKRPDKIPARIIENYANTAAFALALDVTQAANSGAIGVARLISGPALSDFYTGTASVAQAIKGKPEPLGNFAMRNLGGVGGSIAGIYGTVIGNVISKLYSRSKAIEKQK